MADPDLQLRGGGGGRLDLLALPAIFPSVISSFLPKIRGARGARAPPLDPPLKPATGRILNRKLTAPFSENYKK